jgi:hypothetical protein
VCVRDVSSACMGARRLAGCVGVNPDFRSCRYFKPSANRMLGLK